jgi:hypothetical protein
MAAFIRKNELICSGTFVAADGSGAVPVSAELVVTYTGVSGATQTDTIAMGVDPITGIWSAVWDSSNAQGGRVDWMAHCWDGVIAADQGSFELLANAANVA